MTSQFGRLLRAIPANWRRAGYGVGLLAAVAWIGFGLVFPDQAASLTDRVTDLLTGLGGIVLSLTALANVTRTPPAETSDDADA